MDKEKVIEIINGVIIDRVTQMIEDMSNNEFVELIGDKVNEELGYDVNENDEVEVLQDLIGTRVYPLLHKVLEYGIGKDIPLPTK